MKSFVLVATENVSQVLRELRQIDRPVRKVMIAGGGNVGYEWLTQFLNH